MCPGPQVFLCTLLCCGFIMFYACISILQNSWDRWICFLFPPQAAFLPTVSKTSLSFRCFKSFVTDMLLPHLSQVYSPLTTGGCATLSALHHYSFFLPLAFPHSCLTPLRVQCWDSLTFSTSMCLSSSISSQEVHKLASMRQRFLQLQLKGA